MKYFSSITLFIHKAIFLFIISLTFACLVSFPEGRGRACRLLHSQKSHIVSAKTILSHDNTTRSDAVSMQKNVFYQNTAAPEEIRYFTLAGEEIQGDIILRIRAEETPSFSFQMTNASGTSYEPSIHEYSPASHITKLVYHFTWNQTYFFDVQNLQKNAITYSVQYTKDEIKTKETTISKPTSSTHKKPASKSTTLDHKSTATTKTAATNHKKVTASKPNATNHKKVTASKPNTSNHKKMSASKPNASNHKKMPASKSNASNHRKVTASGRKKKPVPKPAAKLTLSKTFLRTVPGKAFQISADTGHNQKASSLHWVIYRKDCLSSRKIISTSNQNTFSACAAKEGTVVIICKWKNLSASCTVKIIKNNHK